MSRTVRPIAADGSQAVPSGRGTEDTRRRTQRERILQALVEIVARDGYAAATISRIIAKAGVSRPTFYDYFTDQEDCFLHAMTAGDEQLVAHVEAVVSSAQAAQSSAMYTATEALLQFCNSQPAIAHVLINASLAAGTRALEERHKTITALAEIVEGSDRRLATDAPLPDIANDVLLGGIYRLLGSKIRQNRPLDGDLHADLTAWVTSYEVPASARRWADLRTQAHGRSSGVVVEPPFGSAPVATRPRARTRNPDLHRQRLLFAAGELSKEKGFQSASIAEITRRAGLGYRRFSHFFADKQEAFLALQELGYRRTLAATAGAYFSRGTWPERVWAAGKRHTEYMGRNPTLAHVGFVEPYSVGSRAAKRMDDALKVFTLFLHEGYAHRSTRQSRASSVAPDAIAATIFEIGFNDVRNGNCAELPELLPQAVLLVLTPFLGHEDAMRFIDSKLAAR